MAAFSKATLFLVEEIHEDDPGRTDIVHIWRKVPEDSHGYWDGRTIGIDIELFGEEIEIVLTEKQGIMFYKQLLEILSRHYPNRSKPRDWERFFEGNK